MSSIVRRYITWFDPQAERLVGEADLQNFPLSELQQLFGEPADQPMYDCYPITPEKLPALQPHVEHTIRLDRYDYFVEAEAASVPETAPFD